MAPLTVFVDAWDTMHMRCGPNKRARHKAHNGCIDKGTRQLVTKGHPRKHVVLNTIVIPQLCQSWTSLFDHHQLLPLPFHFLVPGWITSSFHSILNPSSPPNCPTPSTSPCRPATPVPARVPPPRSRVRASRSSTQWKSATKKGAADCLCTGVGVRWRKGKPATRAPQPPGVRAELRVALTIRILPSVAMSR